MLVNYRTLVRKTSHFLDRQSSHFFLQTHFLCCRHKVGTIYNTELDCFCIFKKAAYIEFCAWIVDKLSCRVVVSTTRRLVEGSSINNSTSRLEQRRVVPKFDENAQNF